MRLVQAETGRWVKVLKIEGGRGLEHKLRQLGLVPGDCARIVRHAPFGGPLLLEIEGRAIALGRGVAARITVEESVDPCA